MAGNFNQERYYSSAGDIYSVLRTLAADRSSISIQFDNSNLVSASMVLEANLQERVFHLDELSTSEAHKRVIAGHSFTLRASINGIRVLAKELSVAQVREDSAGIYYVVAFPERMLYLQRRDAFRAWVPGTLMVQVECKGEHHPKGFKGRMQNMSATGFRLLVEGELKPAPEMMETFQISTRLPLLEQSLTCNATVIYAQYVPERNHTVLGFRFKDMDRQLQQAANRFVTQLQREAIT